MFPFLAICSCYNEIVNFKIADVMLVVNSQVEMIRNSLAKFYSATSVCMKIFIVARDNNGDPILPHVFTRIRSEVEDVLE